MFEGLTKEVFKEIKGIDFADFERMEYADAMRLYGNDKPDLRFGMQIQYLNHLTQNLGFKVFDDAETIAGIAVPNAAEYTRKQLDELTEWVKRPQIGAKGLVYMQCKADGSFKSSVDKFYTAEQLQAIANFSSANAGDLMLIISGKEKEVRKQLSELRLEMGRRLNLMAKNDFKPLWVVNFPLFDYDEETDRYHAMHHPFTSPLPNQLAELKLNPANVMANAYDLVINGVEIGGGSIRIHDQKLQSDMFDVLGFTKEDALAQFGFLMGAFKYGAPPHGGIAFGFDRLCAVLSGVDSIRDFIAFPKNNSGKDTMIDAPSPLDSTQLKELGIKTDL
jgi:aspartyl-tRNA synthetase